MKTYLLDCSRSRCQSDFWDLYLDVIQPEGAEHFGRNLDAFWDAISGGGPGWPGECQLILISTDQLRRQEPLFFEGLRRIAHDLPEHSGATIAFPLS